MKSSRSMYQFSSERYLTAAKLRILEVILYFQHLNLVFRVVVDDSFTGFKTAMVRAFSASDLADAILQHRIVNGAVCF